MSETHEDIAAVLRRLEESLLQPAIRSDPAAVGRLLAEEFREYGSSGRSFTKPQIIAELAGESPRRISLSDFECRLIGSEVALVTYRSERMTNAEELTTALRSSLWVLREGRWQMLFHQGTRVAAG